VTIPVQELVRRLWVGREAPPPSRQLLTGLRTHSRYEKKMEFGFSCKLCNCIYRLQLMFPILQFMAWFDEVEAQVQASQEKCYRLGLASFPSPSYL